VRAPPRGARGSAGFTSLNAAVAAGAGGEVVAALVAAGDEPLGATLHGKSVLTLCVNQGACAELDAALAAAPALRAQSSPGGRRQPRPGKLLATHAVEALDTSVDECLLGGLKCQKCAQMAGGPFIPPLTAPPSSAASRCSPRTACGLATPPRAAATSPPPLRAGSRSTRPA
jgi:hypothetical protein